MGRLCTTEPKTHGSGFLIIDGSALRWTVLWVSPFRDAAKAIPEIRGLHHQDARESLAETPGGIVATVGEVEEITIRRYQMRGPCRDGQFDEFRVLRIAGQPKAIVNAPRDIPDVGQPLKHGLHAVFVQL